jgi:hypothetical protein
MKEKLIELKACKQALEWAGDKTWEEIYNTCHRGDWLLWLFAKTNPNDFRLLTLAKARCANTVRHLMIDERSKNAVDVAIAFGEGEATVEELSAAYNAAYAAYAYADGAVAYAYAAVAAACAAAAAGAGGAACASADGGAACASADGGAAAYAYAAGAAAYAYADGGAAAKKENQKLTADICRKFLPIEIWNV